MFFALLCHFIAYHRHFMSIKSFGLVFGHFFVFKLLIVGLMVNVGTIFKYFNLYTIY